VENAERRTVSLWALAYAIGPMVVAIDSREAIVDNSYLWHITAGHIQRDESRVIVADPFSFTAQGEPWRTQSWLPDVLYSWLDGAFGIASSQFITAVVGTILFVILAVLMRSSVRTGFATALVSVAGVMVLLPYLQPRPVIFSYVLFALVVLACRHPRLLWAVPLILWVWASVHASFPLGFVYLATHWWQTRERRLIEVSIVGLVVTSLTAHGLMIWSVLADFSNSGAALDRIAEWRPPDLISVHLIPLTLALVVSFFHLGRSGVGLRGLLPLLAWTVFGLSATRSVPMLWIVLVPIISQAVDAALSRFETGTRLPIRIAAVAGVALVVWPYALPRADALDPDRFPIEAAEHLSAERVFHDDVTGGYLIYAQWPDRLVYIDDRAELFGDRLVDFADAKVGAPNWRDVVEGTGATQALVRRSDALASLLLEAADWTVIFEDEVFIVFEVVA
jgi:hypothetical protein